MRKMRKSAAVALTAAMAVTSMGVIPAMADETTTIRVMVWDRGDAPQGMTCLLYTSPSPRDTR